MQVIEQRRFTFDGAEYEVRAVADADGIKVAVFHDNKRVNGYVYRVDFATNHDIKSEKGYFGFEHLMDIAESDVRHKYWEKYVEAMLSR